MFTDEKFEQLAKLFMDMIFRLAFNYTKSRAEADDITQNVLIKLYRSDRSFESDAHVKHWLIRVTINECKKAFLSPWKKNASIDAYAATLAFPSPKHGELFHAVMALPRKYRVPIYLHYYEEYSCAEISHLLNIPNATVRTQLRRGREILKSTLQEAGSYV